MSMIDENTEVVEANQIQDGRLEQEDIHTQKTRGRRCGWNSGRL